MLVRRMSLVSLVTLSAVLWSWTSAVADEPSEAQKVAQSVVENYVRMYDTHDPQVMARLFVSDGVFLPPNGSPVAQGREAIERSYAALFKTVGGHETINLRYAIPAGRDSLVAVTEFKIVGDGQTAGKVVSGRAALTLVRTSEGWRYVSIAPQASAPPS